MIANNANLINITDRLNNPLKVGDTVYAAIYHNRYRKRDCYAELKELYVCGGYTYINDRSWLKLSEVKPFSETKEEQQYTPHTYEIEAKDCIKKIK